MAKAGAGLLQANGDSQAGGGDSGARTAARRRGSGMAKGQRVAGGGPTQGLPRGGESRESCEVEGDLCKTMIIFANGGWFKCKRNPL